MLTVMHRVIAAALLGLSVCTASPAFARVEVDGVRGTLRDNVLAHLALDDAPCDVPAWRLRRLVRQAADQARVALEAYGYYNPVITIGEPQGNGCWQVRIVIDPGPQVRLRAVEVTVAGDAADDPAFRKLLARSPLKTGVALDHGAYEGFKRSLGTLARRKGYFAAGFRRAAIEVSARDNVADVFLDWDSGPRYRFGDVRFEQDVLEPDLMQRFVDFAPGDPYDGSKVEDLYDALLATGYFSVVDLRTAPRDPPDTVVPVTVALAPAKRKVYTTGLGYGTDSGPKFRAGYTDRRRNANGHQLDASMNLSGVLSQVGVSYRLPRRDPRVEWFSVDAGYQYKDTETSQSQIWKLGSKALRRRGADWVETRFIDVSTERFEISTDTSRELLLIPGISWAYRTPGTATQTRPERGSSVQVRLSATAEWLGSDAEFAQADLSGKLILPVWDGARLLLRGEAGATAKDRFRNLPASVRYFAGGDYSVRGYDFETLGPSDDTGNVVGGSHKLVGSVEFDQRVWGRWSAAAFFDSGNAFDDFSKLRFKSGVGAGLRWYSPLGPVRIDLAFPLDDDAPDDWRIHVTLGPDL